jgi:predicted nucleic acid-binding protein
LNSYSDSGFLVSLYNPDTNSPRAARILATLSPPVLLTPLSQLEIDNALAQRLFRKEDTATQIRAAQSRIAEHIRVGLLAPVPMPEKAFTLARQIAERRTPLLGNRTLDILHVACAVLLNADIFLSFDDRQLRLAVAEGLRTL